MNSPSYFSGLGLSIVVVNVIITFNITRNFNSIVDVFKGLLIFTNVCYVYILLTFKNINWATFVVDNRVLRSLIMYLCWSAAPVPLPTISEDSNDSYSTRTRQSS